MDLKRLTSLRWYAALLVFLLHLNTVVGWRPLRLFTFGSTGVTFFFVLSGFVLAWSCRPGQQAEEFYLRRFARIYPSMAAALALTAAGAALWSRLPVTTGVLGILTSVFVVQAWFPGTYPVYAYNPVAWSLSAEAVLYAVFPWLVVRVARLNPRTQIVLCATTLGAAGVVSVGLAAAGHGGDIGYNNPLMRLPEFLLGIVLALRMREGWRPRIPMWVATVVVAMSALVARMSPHLPLGDYVMVVPFAMLIVAAASNDLTGAHGWLLHRWSVYLGRVSFCFYLVHYLVLRSVLIALGWERTWGTFDGIAPLVLTLLASLIAAMLLHHLVERPCERWLKSTVATHRKTPRVAYQSATVEE